jgi:hypothetical protein
MNVTVAILFLVGLYPFASDQENPPMSRALASSVDLEIGKRAPAFARGLTLAAISYDSPAILEDFAKRHRIDFPLLADRRSETIGGFNVLNTEAKGMTMGMA